MKMSTLKKNQRYRDWKSKTTKLKALREKHHVIQKNQSPSGIVMGGFVPSGHGFNFTPKKTLIQTDLDDDEEMKSRKRKFFEGDLPEEENNALEPWYARYAMEKAGTDFKQRYDRSVVRATATKNVELLRELLEEKANDPSNLQSAPPVNLFPNYPSRREKYREELNYALLIAVSNNSCDMADMLLSAGAKVSQFNEWYPLVMSAVDNCNVELIQVLMKHGSDANASRHDGSGLHAVARKASSLFGAPCCCQQASNNLRIAELLLEAGANVNLKNEAEGSTPLHEAVRYGHIEAVEFFLKHGADVNIADDKNKRTPLHWGASAGNADIVKALLDKGADALAADNESNAPWMLAMKNKFDSIAKLLCSFHDVNVWDSNGRTPLHVACKAGCTQSVELLLKEGANFNAVDNCGNTPLIEAAEGKSRIVEMLLNCYRINVHNANDDGLAAVHIAVNRLADTTPDPSLCEHDKYSRAAKKTVDLLIAKEADVNMFTADGEALVVKHANNKVVFKCLVAAGADVNAVSEDGDNVLKKTIRQDYDEDSTEHTEKLLKFNVDVERLSRTPHCGTSALQYAASNERLDLLKLLINSGAETSHLVNWLKNTEAGRETYETLSDDIKTFIAARTKGIDLLEIARSAILRHLGHRNVPMKIKELMIPRSLQKFLTHEQYFSWKSESS